MKPAEVFPDSTSTDAGALSAMLLLESVTRVLLAAASLRVTEQATVFGPVTDCVAQDTLLKAAEEVGVATGSNVMTSVCFTPFADPVIVTLTDLVTASATALNCAVFAPDATITEAGSLSAALLLARVTDVELVAEALRYTAQVFVCAPVKDWTPQEIMVSVAAAGEELGAKVTPPQPAKAEIAHPASKTRPPWRRNLFEKRDKRKAETAEGKYLRII